MKKRIIVSKLPNENETKCEYCNKIIENREYKAHLRTAHEIGVRKVAKMEKIPGPIMGINPSIDHDLMVAQNEFEKGLTVLCPFCKKEIISKDFRNHLDEHDDVSLDKITKILARKCIPIVCPLCKITVAPPLRYHFRKVHFMELDMFAEGIFETAGTIKKRKEYLEHRKKS